ncbi:MAG: putative phage abortive infection protein [Pelobium sp.]
MEKKKIIYWENIDYGNTAKILFAIAGSLILLILLFFLPNIVVNDKIVSNNYSHSGEIGDTIGGILGPTIGFFAAILTFLAFYIQYQANKEQRIQFEKQANDVLIERFENRFFEMIRLHRANVDELNIQDIVKGRKVFTPLYFELRYIYFKLEKNHLLYPPAIQCSKATLTNLAYLIFFFGIGHTTDSVFKHIASDVEKEVFFNKTISQLKIIKEQFNTKTNNKDLIEENGTSKSIFKQIYEPFTGHGSKIGHYYRHIYQTIKYVSKQTNPLFTPKLKYSYVKILRAQLSNIEQVLFYYNSVSTLGYSWIKKGYLKDYKMIINLPLSFADFGITPKEMFKQESEQDKTFFDWDNFKDAIIMK